MAEIVEYLARRLVDEPDAVRVEEVDREGDTVLQLYVAPDDVGKVIGRQGRIARALRTVVRASAAREDRRVLLEIMEYAVAGTGMDPYLPLLEEELAFRGADRRAPDWSKSELAPDIDFRVLVIGAGMSGILTARSGAWLTASAAATTSSSTRRIICW